MKLTAPIMTAVFILALIVSSGEAAADVTPVPGGYYVSTDRVAYKYEPNGAIRISEYGVAIDGGPKHIVFASIAAGPFDPTDNPVEHDRTVAVTGTKAAIETHDNPHATLVYRAFDSSSIAFSLDSRIGAISRGDRVVVGDSGFLADLATTNGRTIVKSMDSLLIGLSPDDTLVFRVQGPAGSIGELITSGRLDVELDVMARDMTIHSDATAYEVGATMTVDSISTSRATFSFSGLHTDSVAVVDLSKEVYERFEDHAIMTVDGSQLTRFSGVDGFLESSQPGFAIIEGPSYVEILLRPGASSGSLVIESVVPGFEPLLALAGFSSVIVCAAAGTYLFRRKSR